MTDPRDIPGWTQQREPPDDSECTLLRSMTGDGYILTEDEMNDIFTRMGGQEHVEMLEDLERKGYCKEENRPGVTAWVLTDQGKKALGLV